MKNIFWALSLFTAQLNVTAAQEVAAQENVNAAQEIQVPGIDTQRLGCFTRCLRRIGMPLIPRAHIENGNKLVANRISAAQFFKILSDHEEITEINLKWALSSIEDLDIILKAFPRVRKSFMSTKPLSRVLPVPGKVNMRDQD